MEKPSLKTRQMGSSQIPYRDVVATGTCKDGDALNLIGRYFLALTADINPHQVLFGQAASRSRLWCIWIVVDGSGHAAYSNRVVAAACIDDHRVSAATAVDQVVATAKAEDIVASLAEESVWIVISVRWATNEGVVTIPAVHRGVAVHKLDRVVAVAQVNGLAAVASGCDIVVAGTSVDNSACSCSASALVGNDIVASTKFDIDCLGHLISDYDLVVTRPEVCDDLVYVLVVVSPTKTDNSGINIAVLLILVQRVALGGLLCGQVATTAAATHVEDEFALSF